jgi:putative Ca2+/H+ antiporter (TMEM165/GDT1 family)
MRVASSGPRPEFVPRFEPIVELYDDEDLPEDEDLDEESEAEEAARNAKPGNGPFRAMLTSFTVITIAEFGDLTQIVTANLAAKYDWLPVGIGALVALWAVAALAILGGQALLRFISLKWITRVAAAIMAALAVISLISAIRG